MSNSNKIVWSFASILLIVLGLFTPFLQGVNYYNLSIENQNEIEFQIEFANELNLTDGDMTMSITNISVGNVIFSDDSLSNSILEDDILKFDFVSDSIPTYFSLDFPGVRNQMIKINRMSMLFNGQEIVLPLRNFIKNPAVEHNEPNTVLFVDNTKEFGYTPYKYRMPVLYFHEIKWSEILIWISISILASFLISQFVNACWNPVIRRTIHRDEVLIYLVSVSLLFNEHWNSKVLILIGLFLLYDVLITKKKINRIQFGSFVLLFFYFGISLIWSIDVSKSLILLGRLVPLVLIPIWLSPRIKYLDFSRVFNTISLTYILFGLISIFLAALRYFTSNNFDEFFYHALLGPLGGANAIYIALLFSMIVLFMVSELNFERLDFSFLLIILFLLVYIVMLSSKMISVLVTLGVLIITVGKLKHNVVGFRKKIIFLGVGLIVLLGILSSSKVLQSRYLDVMDLKGVREAMSKEHFGPVYPWNGLSLRLFQLRSFWEIETNSNFNSILGVGLNNGQALLDESYDYYELYKGKDPSERGGYYVYNFHNQYAETLIETGIVGFVLLSFVLFQLVSFAIRKKSYLLFSVVFVLGCLMFSESLLMRSKGIVAFAFFPMVVYQYIIRERGKNNRNID